MHNRWFNYMWELDRVSLEGNAVESSALPPWAISLPLWCSLGTFGGFGSHPNSRAWIPWTIVNHPIHPIAIPWLEKERKFD